MTCLLAVATPEANSYLQFWLAIGFTGGVVVNIVTVIVLLTNRKQKREVSFEINPASDEECTKRHQDSLKEIARVETEVRELRAERKKDVGDLHDRITDVAAEVSGLNATQESTTQQVAAGNAKLDRLIERFLR